MKDFANVAQIRATRANGRRRLVGEPFDVPDYIRIEINQGEVVNDELTGEDRIFNKITKPVLVLSMSAYQWGQFVGSFGIGNGVTCTLDQIGKKPVDQEYITPDPFEASNKTIDNTMLNFINEQREYKEEIHKVLQKKSVGKKDRETILNYLDRFDNLVENTLPFIKKQLRESADESLSRAQTQISYTMQNYKEILGNKRLDQK